MIMLRRSLVWLVVLALAACASAVRQPETGSANVITRSELDAVGSLSTYDAVQRLRPVFLRDRGPTSLLSAGARTRPAVFIDMTEYGELESLRVLPASHVQEVRFYPGSQATTKFGSTYGAGVVQVTMRVQ